MINEKLTNRVKIISTFLLFVCLFLPLPSCSRYVDSEGKLIIDYDSESPPPGGKLITTYTYPFKEFDIKEPLSWLFIFCFLWPIPILVYRHKGYNKLIKNILWGIEPLFVVGASWYIYSVATFLEEPAIGYYLAIIACSGYGLAWLIEVINKFIYKVKRL